MDAESRERYQLDAWSSRVYFVSSDGDRYVCVSTFARSGCVLPFAMSGCASNEHEWTYEALGHVWLYAMYVPFGQRKDLPHGA